MADNTEKPPVKTYAQLWDLPDEPAARNPRCTRTGFCLVRKLYQDQPECHHKQALRSNVKEFCNVK